MKKTILMALMAAIIILISLDTLSAFTERLQDADTENMGEAVIFSTGPNNNYGGTTQVHIRNETAAGEGQILMKFNLTPIYNDAATDITNATLCLYMYFNTLDSASNDTLNVTTHHLYTNFTVDSIEWDEGDGVGGSASAGEITWNERPNETLGEFNATHDYMYNFTGNTTNGYICFNVNNSVSTEFAASASNVSFYIKISNQIGAFGEFDELRFRSKESTSTDQHPYLNVTYASTNPHITFESPTNTTFATGDIDYNITIDIAVIESFVSIDGGSNLTMTNDSATHYYNISSQHTTLSDGSHNATFWVNSTAGNTGIGTVWFIVDTTSPSSTFGNDPVDTFNSSTSSLTFELKCSDNIDLNTLQLWGNFSGTWQNNQTNSSPINDTFWNVSVPGIADGYYMWGIFCNDTIGNSNWSSTNRTFTVGTVPFWYANETDIPSQYNPRASVFNITWNTTVGNYTDTVYIESNWTGSAVNYTMTNTTYGSSVYNYSILLGANTYYWRSYASSTAGNWNGTDSWTFTITQNTTNPIHINMSHVSGTFQDQNISITTTVVLTTLCVLQFSGGGTCNLFYDSNQVASPHVTTHGVGTHFYLANITGNTNYSSNTTGLNLTLNVTTAGGSGGTGGPGGGGGPRCGNGYCESGETEETCPVDCIAAIPNFTFHVLPANAVIAHITSSDSIWIDEISILNPNADNISVSVFISCEEGDQSCEWLWLISGNDTEEKEINILVGPGTGLSPGRERIRVRMTTPADIEITDYRAIINFKAIGQEKVVAYELRSFAGLGLIGYIFDLLNTVIPLDFLPFDLPVELTVWMVLGVFIVVLLVVVIATTRKKKLPGPLQQLK